MVLSRTQWPATAANVVGTRRLSATFTRPADYVSYQLKGSASVRLAEAEDRDRAERYIARMRATFAGLGLAPGFVDAWLQTEDPLVMRLAVEADGRTHDGDVALRRDRERERRVGWTSSASAGSRLACDRRRRGRGLCGPWRCRRG